MLLLLMMHMFSLGPIIPRKAKNALHSKLRSPILSPHARSSKGDSEAALDESKEAKGPPTTPSSQPFNADASTCAAFSRGFVPEDMRDGSDAENRLVHDVPPLLWSFPGSGNTVARLLLDHASGFYTGAGAGAHV